ncbi:Gamete and mating-type specific protein [Tieghemostelium lacteum]|uniref:Gamete and mating-type specific protein n=1 Tax=Tieghemostelium lacteum TaxID=361077 RepID=A0A151Z9A7_TIELA|nr:Gamete and mating-type specific protein [Tieghemostelium lacteum]|eukprot:KYQ90541.1 Gamete and mating-type specific protein [Tieghemostelium lacteum]
MKYLDRIVPLVLLICLLFGQSEALYEVTPTDRVTATNILNTHRANLTPKPYGGMNQVSWSMDLENLIYQHTANCASNPLPATYANVTTLIYAQYYPNATAFFDLILKFYKDQYDYFTKGCKNTDCYYYEAAISNSTTQFACAYSKTDCTALNSAYSGVYQYACFFSPYPNYSDYPYKNQNVINSFSAADIDVILNYLNNERNTTKVKPSVPLSKLVWNQTLADGAAEYLEKCDYRQSEDAAYGYVLESTISTYAPGYDLYNSFNGGVYPVKLSYSYWDKTCSPYLCDPYLYMIKNTTQSVGCARKTCVQNGYAFVQTTCRYYPPAPIRIYPFPTNEVRPGPPPAPEPTGSIDWRRFNKVSPVKNQGGCGSCWAFSAAGAIESALLMKSNQSAPDTFDVSEQEFVSCTGPSSQGCNGGWPLEAMNRKNVTVESYTPYQGETGQCSDPSPYRPLLSWSGAEQVKQDKNTFVQALKDHGPFSICLYVGGDFYSYSGGVYEYKKMSPGINHAVLLVGYDLPGDYWIIKNSWGEYYGEDGYINIKADVDDFGKILEYGYRVIA